MHDFLPFVFLPANSEASRVCEQEHDHREMVVEGVLFYSLKATPLLFTLGWIRHRQFLVIEFQEIRDFRDPSSGYKINVHGMHVVRLVVFQARKLHRESEFKIVLLAGLLVASEISDHRQVCQVVACFQEGCFCLRSPLVFQLKRDCMQNHVWFLTGVHYRGSFLVNIAQPIPWDLMFHPRFFVAFLNSARKKTCMLVRQAVLTEFGLRSPFVSTWKNTQTHSLRRLQPMGNHLGNEAGGQIRVTK